MIEFNKLDWSKFENGVTYVEVRSQDASGRPVVSHKAIGPAPTAQRRGHGYSSARQSTTTHAQSRGVSLAGMRARLAELERATSANPMHRVGMEIARLEAALKGGRI